MSYKNTESTESEDGSIQDDANSSLDSSFNTEKVNNCLDVWLYVEHNVLCVQVTVGNNDSDSGRDIKKQPKHYFDSNMVCNLLCLFYYCYLSLQLLDDIMEEVSDISATVQDHHKEYVSYLDVSLLE